MNLEALQGETARRSSIIEVLAMGRERRAADDLAGSWLIGGEQPCCPSSGFSGQLAV